MWSKHRLHAVDLEDLVSFQVNISSQGLGDETEKAMATHSSTLPGKSHGWRRLVGCSSWVATSQTRLNDFTFPFHFYALEKEMATHSNVLA